MKRGDYRTRRWALAFAGPCPEGGELGRALELLGALVPVVKKIPGKIGGAALAKRLEGAIREGARKTGADEEIAGLCGRFLALLIRKNFFFRVDEIMGEIKNIADAAKGILPVYVESAFPMDEKEQGDFIEGIRRETGAGEIRLDLKVNPELLGGCRVRIGAELIDASLRGQLQKMAAELAAEESQFGG
jgi:F-type H+-transporting ATPase subunit delta